MLGLLGTVTGMILVFDELAREQSSISQLSESIAMATFPTLVGMVVSIVGIMAFSRLTRLSQKKMTLLEKELRSR
jgi:biopolymer transport protein ExbB